VADFHSLSIINLSDDAQHATPDTPIRDPAFHETFAAAHAADRYLTVNSATEDGRPPYTVLSVPAASLHPRLIDRFDGLADTITDLGLERVQDFEQGRLVQGHRVCTRRIQRRYVTSTRQPRKSQRGAGRQTQCLLSVEWMSGDHLVEVAVRSAAHARSVPQEAAVWLDAPYSISPC
jgi:hypothetical protein